MKHYNAETFDRIEGFIDDYRFQQQINPTIREISEGLDIPHATVARYLHKMTDDGILQYNGYRHITTKKSKKEAQMVYVPMCGTIQC